MYDLIIIGGGPGGYGAALLGSKKGLSVLLIEENRIGGVCLNRGCIPAKSYISMVKSYGKILSLRKLGIFSGDNLSLNWEKARLQKRKVVDTLVSSVEKSIKKQGGDIVYGSGKLLSPGVVEAGSEVFEGKNVVIATGSIPFIPAKWGDLLTGEGVLDLEKLPEKVVIIGGGIIGVETAFWMNGFGVEVEVVEMMPVLLPQTDIHISKILEREFKKRKIKFHLSSPVEDIKRIEGGFVVITPESKIETEDVIVALGRRPSTGWEGKCIDKDKEGWIEVDEFWRTSMPGHFAIGDVTGKGMLAHTAYFGAEQVVKIITGAEAVPYDPYVVPRVVFTEPEIAWVGRRKVDLEREGINFGRANFQMRWTGRALAEGEISGKVIVYYEKESRKLLGFHVAGSGSGEFIHVCQMALAEGLSVNKFEKVIASHPTFFEAVKEAVSSIDGWNIHGG